MLVETTHLTANLKLWVSTIWQKPASGTDTLGWAQHSVDCDRPSNNDLLMGAARLLWEWWGEGGWRWLLCLTFILRLSDFCPLTQRQDNWKVARRGRKKGSSVGLTDEQTSVAVTVTLSRLSSGSEQQCRPERLLRRYVPVLQQSSELYTFIRNRCSTSKKI